MKVEVTEIENDKILMNTKFYSWEKCKSLAKYCTLQRPQSLEVIEKKILSFRRIKFIGKSKKSQDPLLTSKVLPNKCDVDIYLS